MCQLFSSIYFADNKTGHSPPTYQDVGCVFKFSTILNTQHNPKGIWFKWGQKVQIEARQNPALFPPDGQPGSERFTHQVASLSCQLRIVQTQPARRTVWIWGFKKKSWWSWPGFLQEGKGNKRKFSLNSSLPSYWNLSFWYRAQG